MKPGLGEPLCDTLVDHLVDVCQGTAESRLQAHAVSCARCRVRVRDTQALARALQALPAVALPAGFEAQLQARLQALAPAPMPDRPESMTGLALAAALACTVLLATWVSWPRLPAVDMLTTQLVSLDVEIETAMALPGTHLQVALPAGLKLATQAAELQGLQELRWTQDLQPGRNRFTLVLQANDAGQHRVRVQVTAAGEHAHMDLLVRVAAGEQASVVIDGPAHAGWLRLAVPGGRS